MEVAGLAFGVISTIDVCIRAGKAINAFRSDFKHAGEEIEDQKLLAAALWGRVEPQLLVLRRTAPSLSEGYLDLQKQMLERLDARLKDLRIQFDKISITPSFQKYVTIDQEGKGGDSGNLLECGVGPNGHVCRDLRLHGKQQQEMSDTLTFDTGKSSIHYTQKALCRNLCRTLSGGTRDGIPPGSIARLALPEIDAEIHEHRLENDDAAPLKIMGSLRDALRANVDTNSRSLGFLSENVTFYLPKQINFSTATISARSDSHALVILDNIEYRPNTSEVDISNDVQNLARVMSTLDPVTCNLLRCQGVKRNVDAAGRLRGFSLAFRMPPAIRSSSKGLVSLRGDGESSAMVSDDYGEYTIHTTNNFQTSIRSLRDSLLHQTSAVSISHRLAIAKSMARAVIFLHSASFVHKNIRPEIVLTTESGASYLVGFQKFRAAAGHTYMSGDTLWHENLYRHPTRQGMGSENMYTMLHDVYSLGVCLLEIGLWASFVHYALGANGESLVLPGMLEIAAVPKMRDERKRAFELKRILTDLAVLKLPSCMGDKYTSLVVSCLSCLDRGSAFMSDDTDDGVDLGAR